MGTSRLKIGLLQHSCGPDAQANIAKALDLAKQAISKGAQIICTQELFRTIYFCQTEHESFFDLAEPIDGPTFSAFSNLAKTYNVAFIISIFERRAPGLYHNSALVIDTDGSLVGLYRKLHIPHDTGFYEKFYFTPGDLSQNAFATRLARIGIGICWDQWFPETARMATLNGAELLFYPSAIGWLPGERKGQGLAFLDAWIRMHQAHAIANGVFVIAVNRVGFEKVGLANEGHDENQQQGIEFWGHSLVCDPLGRLIAVASSQEDQALIVDIELSQIEVVRRQWPFLRDRRPEIYSALLERFAYARDKVSRYANH